MIVISEQYRKNNRLQTKGHTIQRVQRLQLKAITIKVSSLRNEVIGNDVLMLGKSAVPVHQSCINVKQINENGQ